jgi:hypothetical protein
MATHKHRTAAPRGHRGSHVADLGGRAGTLPPAILLALMLAGCAGEPGAPTGSMATSGASASAQDATVPAGSPLPAPALAPDRMPAALSDFPLPHDVVFVAPPRHEFGRLIVGLNSKVGDDEVAALFDAELEKRGYAIERFVDGGVRQWQFVKDGRNGVVDLDQNRLATVININLMQEGDQ